MAYEKVTLYGVPLVAARQVNYGRHRPRRCPASCSSGTRWSRATGTPTTRSSTTTASCSTRSRSWSTGPAAATSSSTTRRCSTSTTSACRPTSSPAGTSTPGGRRPDGSARPARLRRGRCWSTRTRRGVDAADYPGHLAAGRAGAAADLPVRAGRGRRRRDRAHPAARAQPACRRRLRLAGPGPARGPGHRADPVAAQGAARATSCRRPTTPALWSTRSTGASRRRSRCSTRWRASCADPDRRASCRRDAWDLDRVPDHLRMTFRRRGRARGRGRRGQGPRRRCKQRAAPRRCAQASSRAAAALERTGLTRLDVRRAAATPSSDDQRRLRPCRAIPALVDEGDTRRACGCSTPRRAARAAMWPGTRRLLLLTVAVAGRARRQAAVQPRRSWR